MAPMHTVKIADRQIPPTGPPGNSSTFSIVITNVHPRSAGPHGRSNQFPLDRSFPVWNIIAARKDRSILPERREQGPIPRTRSAES